MINEVIEATDKNSQMSFQEVLKRIAEFTLVHPEKIKEWKRIDDEKYYGRVYYGGVISERKIKQNKTPSVISQSIKESAKYKDTEELINKCMLVCPNKFVNGVKTFFNQRGFISEKQRDALERILDQGRIGEDYFG